MWISKATYNSIINRIKTIESEMKMADDVCERGYMFPSHYSLGAVVGEIFRRKRVASDILVTIPTKSTDCDWEEYDTTESAPLSDVIAAILKHCELEIIPKHEVEAEARKKK